MAHTKAVGSTKLGRDSAGRRLGIKITDGERAGAGEIIVRQRGTKFLPGRGVRRAGDDTLYARTGGVVRFTQIKKTRFDGSRRYAKRVEVASQ